MAYEFGPFRLEPEERRLTRGGEAIPLTPKAFDLLVILVEQPERLLKKEALMERLWPGVFVEEVNLAQNVSAIRRALGEGKQTYIQTVAGAGYRFAAPVTRHDAAARPDRARLLVLPFRMLKADPDLDFLAFSLPDALTATLSGLDTLVVRSSLVAARFAGDAPDLPRIAREAQVDYVVSGTILRAGAQLRVSAQLADATAGTLLWSHTVQAPVEDLFQLQDSLVGRIAESISRPLTTPEERRLRQDVPASAKAYEFFLRANQATPPSAFSLERATIARDLYLQALADDPAYAPAWARIARVYRLLGKYVAEDGDANLARADEALQRALALNPDLSLAHNLYAQIEVDRGRAEHAMVRLLGRLRARGPNAEIYAGLVQACRFCGLLDASEAAHVRARAIDPALGTSAMHTYFLLGRWQDVIVVSGDVKGYVYSLSLVALGKRDDALALVSGVKAGVSPIYDMLAAVHALIEGRREDGAAALARAARKAGDPESLYYLSRHLAYLGARDAAVDLFGRSVRGGYACAFRAGGDPWFAALRNDPEFQVFLEHASRAHESAAAAFNDANGSGLLLPA